MDKFWELFAQSHIVSGIIAIGLLAAIIYLAVTGQEVPELLSATFTTIIGFYFGSKVERDRAEVRARARLEQ